MASGQQRARLAPYLNVRQRFHATFDHVTHRIGSHKQQQAVILLRDIYPVNQDGRKIRLVGDDHVVESHGKRVAADHAWVELYVSFLKLGTELLNNDEIEFSAVVKPYDIVRDDVAQSRRDILKVAQDDSQAVFEAWLAENKAWHAGQADVKKKREAIYHWYRNNHGLVSFKEMRAEQDRVSRDYEKTRPEGIEAVKRRQAKIMAAAHEKADAVKLVDYELTAIRDVKITKTRDVHYGWTRGQYDASRLKDRAYTRYLAARSMAYCDKVPFVTWSNG